MKPSTKFKTARLPLLIAFALPFVVSLAPSASAQPPPGTLWYNGDFTGDGADAQFNQIGFDPETTFCGGPTSQTYDDFTVTWPFGWNVTEVFSDTLLDYFCENPSVTGAVWEIRQGVSAGNPGVQIAQGFTVTPVLTATGRSWNYHSEWRVEVQGLNVFLSPGTYHLNVTPIGNGQGAASNSNTTGTDCVGTPCGNNGNAFQNVPNGPYWQPVNGDFAMGLVGSFFNGSPQLVEGGSFKQGFKIMLPINGESGIEDRSGQPGGAYTITMTFNENIASVARASASCGKVASTSIDGATLTINLTKVSCNASHITVTANDVKDSAGISLDTACLTMGLLLGDVNGDGVVDSADLDIVNSQIGQPTNGENFRSDINNDGVISAADVQIVTRQQGTHLP